MLSRRLTPDPKWVLVGMAMAVLPDLDAFLPGIEHHGPMHTPLFAILICATLGGALGRTLPAVVCATGILSHLVLDTIVSESGLMWLYPHLDAPTSLWRELSLPVYAVLRVFLLTFPVVWIMEMCNRHGQGISDILVYLRVVVGPRLAAVSTTSASVIIAIGAVASILPWVL
jgi:hypothetical protein